METVVCLHGFGVREEFWSLVRRLAGDELKVETPSFSHPDAETAVASVAHYLGHLARLDARPVHVVGHSLGGALGALAAQNLPSSVVASVTIVSSPWGDQSGELPWVYRTLIRRGLLPGWVVRPRFFGPRVPPKVQKDLFRGAVPEAPGLRAVLDQRPWFHTKALHGPYPHRVLGIGSAADRIVAAAQTEAFAKALGGRSVTVAAADAWGHDDPAVDEAVARRFWDLWTGFVAEGRDGGGI